jgi:hypothetical protein
MRKTRLAITKDVNARILLLRGQKVIIDSDLAELYGVEVKHLNQQVKRNHRRFPQDFVFRLRPREAENLRSQIVTSSLTAVRILPLQRIHGRDAQATHAMGESAGYGCS